MQLITLEELESKLKEWTKSLQNKESLLRQIGNHIQNTSELSFERQKSPFGNAWKPNSKVTLQGKRGNKILIKSGGLSHSIHYQTSNNSVSIGTNIKYAPIHQFGGKAGRNKRVNIPARPFLPINQNKQMPKDLGIELEEMVKEWVEEGFGK